MSLQQASDSLKYTQQTSYSRSLLSLCGVFVITLLITGCGMLLDDPALYPDMEVAGEESNESNNEAPQE
mgnify:CR=1 FL=1